MHGCLLLNDLIVSLTPRTQTSFRGPKRRVLFILLVSLKSRKSMLYLGSGCSRHMTGDKKKFVNFKKKE